MAQGRTRTTVMESSKFLESPEKDTEQIILEDSLEISEKDKHNL